VLGPSRLKLLLIIPLEKPEETKVKGEVEINNALVNLTQWRLAMANIVGKLQFTENSVNANLQGLVFNKLAKVNLDTLIQNDNRVIRTTIVNHIYLSDLQAWLNLPLANYAQGDTDLTTTIDIASNQPLQIHLNSNLEGVNLDLPAGYAKKISDKIDFNADLMIADDQPLRMLVDYGTLLNAALILDTKGDTYKLQAANLRLGSGVAAWPINPGLYISGELADLDWSKLSGYAANSSGESSSLPLKGIDLTVKKINLGMQTLTDTRIQAKADDANWNVTIDNKNVAGQIQFPKKMDRQSTINAQFARVNFISSNSESAAPTTSIPTVDVKTLPAITLGINELSYNGAPLGHLLFKASPSTSGLSIDTLQLVSPRINLQSSGNWTTKTTSLHGNLTSIRVSELIGNFGFDVHNFIVNKGSLDFDLNWNGMPFAPDPASLNGTARLNLGEGRIINVGQDSGAKMDLGRLLSIFSLQTLPRRLNFDFSDVFEKGYSFDTVKADFSFKDGNVYTDNMRFEGPVAKVSVDGRIGLKAKDLNLILTVNAHVTSSIPVAATLLTGQPLIGLAALAVNTVIGSQMSKAAATFYYAVTGTWANPSWKSLSKS